MAIGNPVQQGGLNADLGNMAVNWKVAANTAIALWSYVLTLGANEAAQVAALEALGFTATDAQNFWTLANGGFALSQVYLGLQTQPAVFDYDSELAAARGASI